MTALSALRQDVCPHVPECPLPVVDDAILTAVIDFCNRSRAYRLIPEDIPVLAGTGDYDVDLPQGTAIAWVLAAELTSAQLTPADPGSIPLSWATEQGVTTVAVVVEEVSIGLRKIPDVADTLRLSLALRPSLTATAYPNELHALYRKHIAAGALEILHSQPNKPWSDVEQAAYCRGRFEDGVSAAEYRADRGSASALKRTALCLIGGR